MSSSKVTVTKKGHLKLQRDDVAATRRARQVIARLVKAGKTDYYTLAQKCDATILSLLDGGTPILSRPQFILLSQLFGVNLFWLWTGYGPPTLKDSPKEKFSKS